jgi:Mn2+/Fe2+ NRAMP family transporter
MRVLQALGVVLLASGAGAVGGLTYSLTRPTLERLGWPGDYLAGIVCVAAYFGAIAAVAPLFGEPIIDDLPGLVIFAFCAVLFGILVGKFIQEARKQRTPSG